jgi:NDP-sugar pyrophosphorylase family protein
VLQELTPRLPAALVPCVDRPILQHLVEYLVDRGLGTFDFVLHESACEIEEFLGDGTRWGSKFTYHLIRDPKFPYDCLKLLSNDGQPVLLVHADCMPILPDRQILEQQAALDTFLYVSQTNTGENTSEWTGSAILRRDVVDALADGATRVQLEQHLRRFASEETIASIDVLDFRDFGALLAAQRRILSNSAGITHLAAREVEPGTWIGRNVTIHPTAQLTPPVFIGENSRIGSSAKIGPNAVVGHDSIIDKHTEVIDSAVLPGSYCGENLELAHVIVDRNRLVSTGLGSAVKITDTFILSGLHGKSRKHSSRSIISGCFAAFLFVISLPLLLVTGLTLLFFRRAPLVYSKPVVHLPASEEDGPLKTFRLYSFRNPAGARSRTRISWLLLDFLPALGQVVAGRLHLIGLCPRTEEEIKNMPDDWRSLYLQGHAGLLTEAFVVHGPAATEDEVYSCEAYYTAMNTVGHDVSLVIRFVTSMTQPTLQTSAEEGSLLDV